MNSVTEPVEEQPRQGGNGRSAKEWLDTLAAGGCDLDAFLHGVGELLQRNPDAGWDLLALVDQYYRRGKISAESFGILKAHLQRLLIGKGQRNDPPPLPSLTAAPMHTAPVAVPAAALRPAPRPPQESRKPEPRPALESRPAPESRPASESRPAPESHPAPESPAAPESREAPELRQSPAPPRAVEDVGRPPRTLAIGDVLRGRYVVQDLLGHGGMGSVFAAIDQYRVDRSQGEQRVALKVLHTDVVKRPRLFTELRREFQHLQSLSHPNVVRVHEFDHDGDLAFFTMEYLSGSMLSRLLTLRDSTLPRACALAIVRDVGSAIAHAHSRGVVHGDLNPGNIFITEAGEVRVFDFGASHQLRRGPLVSELDGQDTPAVATSLYASCQVLEGAPATVSDDIYALACVTYLLLAGDQPFHEDNALKARSAKRRPARPRGLHARQWRALKAGLQFDRERRPSDVQDWLTQLDLHAAAPHLPPLPALSALRTSTPYNFGRWMKYAAVTVIIALCGWWTDQHYDTVVGGASNLEARSKSWFDLTALSQWWERSRAMGRKPDPVIDYPSDSDEVASAPVTAPAPAQLPDVARPAGEIRHELPPVTPAPARVAAAPVAPRATPPVMPVTPPPVPPPPVTARPAPVAAVSTAASTSTPTVATGAGTPPAATATPFTGTKAHLELASDTVEVSPTDSVAHLVVRRTHSSRGEVSFTWWTESGTALPGRDFTAVPAHVETIENGQTAANLSIPVVANPARQVPRNFYVVIDQPSDNATVGPRTLTMVSLVGAN